MPGAVGAGTFWTGMVDYVGGKSAADVTATIESSWPK
jgi:alpha-glucoside transport system substrate-binding protein